MSNEVINDQPASQDQQAPDQNNQAPSKQPEEKSSGTTKFYKEELEKFKKQNEILAKQIEEVSTARLKEKENWKELYESETRKREEAETKARTLSETYVESLKMKEIEKMALSLGIRDSALEDLDLLDKSSIQVETTSSGRINFLGVKDFVENIKQRRSYWFKDSKAPTMNNSQPGDPIDRPLTASDILKLEKDNPAKYREIMLKRLSK